ncbi:unnamed protein product [Prunus armeniaca]
MQPYHKRLFGRAHDAGQQVQLGPILTAAAHMQTTKAASACCVAKSTYTTTFTCKARATFLRALGEGCTTHNQRRLSPSAVESAKIHQILETIACLNSYCFLGMGIHLRSSILALTRPNVVRQTSMPKSFNCSSIL